MTLQLDVLGLCHTSRDRVTGLQTSGPGRSLTFDDNQPDELTNYTSGSTGATYSYDGDGLRTGKTVTGGSTEGYLWDIAEGLPTILQDGSTRFITGPDGLPIEQVDGSGTVEYYTQDQLGSTRGLLDASGAVVGSYTFTPYGEPKGHSGASTPFGYAGQYTDSESGLQYLRARYYDPSTAQFLTVDPLVGSTMEPYGYAGGDALNLVDPSGLKGGPGAARLLQINETGPRGALPSPSQLWSFATRAAGWAVDQCGWISAGTGLAAIAAVGVPPLSAGLGIASVVTGACATAVDYSKGDRVATLLDAAALVPGGAAVRYVRIASSFGDDADATWQLLRRLGPYQTPQGVASTLRRYLQTAQSAKANAWAADYNGKAATALGLGALLRSVGQDGQDSGAPQGIGC